MGTLLAHVAGVPLEELLVPLSSIGIVAIAASAAGRIRARLHRRRRAASPSRRL